VAQGKVLVVEDELPTARMIKATLESAGYEVAQAFDGSAALEMVEQEQPDLILLDIRLPNVDGWEVLRTLRARPATEFTPVIVLTALSDNRHVAKGWTLGTDCYLTKPFKPDALLAMVNRFMELDQPPSAGTP
jgi:DNA-binding response OmpR family regulator